MRSHVLGAALCAAIGALAVVQPTAGNASGLDCAFELTTLADGLAIPVPTRCCDPAASACAALGAAPTAPSLELPNALGALLTLPARIVDVIPMLGPERERDPREWKMP